MVILINLFVVPVLAQTVDVSAAAQQNTVDQITDLWYTSSYGFCALCLIMSLINIVQGKSKKSKKGGKR